eukprot:7059669-Alexandrium_andersonii.AAC.1
MSASLVGSEMCIRDRSLSFASQTHMFNTCPSERAVRSGMRCGSARCPTSCLLYTSDAADDM